MGKYSNDQNEISRARDILVHGVEQPPLSIKESISETMRLTNLNISNNDGVFSQQVSLKITGINAGPPVVSVSRSV